MDDAIALTILKFAKDSGYDAAVAIVESCQKASNTITLEVWEEHLAKWQAANPASFRNTSEK